MPILKISKASVSGSSTHRIQYPKKLDFVPSAVNANFIPESFSSGDSIPTLHIDTITSQSFDVTGSATLSGEIHYGVVTNSLVTSGSSLVP